MPSPLTFRARIFCFWNLIAVMTMSTARAVVPVTYTATDLYTLQIPTGYGTIAPNVSGSMQVAAGGQVIGAGNGSLTDGHNHSLTWGPTGTATDLYTAGYLATEGYGTSGAQQVGLGVTTGPVQFHALMWNGTSASTVDLHPSGANVGSLSSAFATNGSKQVGYVAVSEWAHAALWSGTAASFVDLHPAAGYQDSYAWGLSPGGDQQCGFGQLPVSVGYPLHAMIWAGSAASAVDIHPASFFSSEAFATNGIQQVGRGNLTDYSSPAHAMLWSGSAASFIDLNPAGFLSTTAAGIGSIEEVGFGSGAFTNNQTHALVWFGSASDFTDLDTLLAPGFSESRAFTVDGSGNIFGWARTGSGTYHAIEWSPVPEPGSFVCLVSCTAALLLRLARKRDSSEVTDFTVSNVRRIRLVGSGTIVRCARTGR